MRECQLCKHCYPDSVETCPTDGMPTTHTIAGEPVLEGKYHLDLRLGQGGMGVVYKARHAYLKTQLAIKIILPDLVGNDPELVTRFRQEALAAAAIRHMNVVAVTDYGVINGSIPFLVMEYVEGESLHDLLAREKKLSAEQAFDLMSAICAGVGAAHHQGIVHRDLKPLNIMICSDKPSISQAVKILDFGLAKIKSGELLGSFIQAQTTGLMGSPYYMAPEQWADEDPDSRADIYSLGVMLYQMLAGDVPFKGSSIPAIMKKHISDPAPTFAESGAQIEPALERAVLHTLEKDPNNRTASVEMLVEEMRQAIYPGAPSIHTSATPGLPASSLKIRTSPPSSHVYVDDVSVGVTTASGLLLLDGVQSGRHHVRVSHDGFEDWQSDVVCDGQPKEIVAELKDNFQTEVMPRSVTHPVIETSTGDVGINSLPPDKRTPSQIHLDRTLHQKAQTGRIEAPPPAEPRPAPTKRKSFLSPLILGIAAILGLFVIGIIGVTAAYLAGAFDGIGNTSGNRANTAPPSPGVSPTPVAGKGDMVLIPGGSFTMGRNDGRENERPENTVTVGSFYMDKTEVTNAEFLEFIEATAYKPAKPEEFLAHWVNGKPIKGHENRPVRFVNVADANAFAAWRSKRDGFTYRLPTEAEWEYAARNGAKNDLYPWGDTFRSDCAVIDQGDTEPKDAGTASCPDDWGIVDLIGNVYEWTGTRASLYPGSTGELRETKEPRYMIRGGAALSRSTGDLAITSTFRVDIDESKRDKELGFRLVRAE